jgi:RNA polymerase sigma-70 factor, ECF subfamily
LLNSSDDHNSHSNVNYNDSELINLYITNKDNDAFKVLYNRYKDNIYNYIKNFLFYAPLEVIHEILNETFIEMYLNLFKLNNFDAFKPWLYQIARYKCIHYIKERKRTKTVPLIEDESNHLLDHRVNLEKDIIEVEMRKFLLKQIGNLDDKNREIVILKFFNKLTYEDIAKMTGIPIRTLKRNMNKIFYLLKEKLLQGGYNPHEK